MPTTRSQPSAQVSAMNTIRSLPDSRRGARRHSDAIRPAWGSRPSSSWPSRVASTAGSPARASASVSRYE